MISRLLFFLILFSVFSQEIEEIFSEATEEGAKRLQNLKSIGLVDIYLINLDRRTERLQNFIPQIDYLKLPYKRLSAVDGKKLQQYLKKELVYDYKFHPDTLLRFDWLVHPSSLGLVWDFGAIGCWQSHLQSYFAILENYKKTLVDGPVLIFEDDVYLDKDMPEVIKNSLSLLPDNWDIFYIGYTLNPPCLHDVTKNICRAYDIVGAHSYIVNGSKSAKKMIDMVNLMENTVIDYALRWFYEKNLYAYILHEQVVMQDTRGFKSDIPLTPKVPVVKLKNPIKPLGSK